MMPTTSEARTQRARLLHYLPLLSALLLLLCSTACRSSGRHTTTEQSQSTPARLRAMTFNVRYANDGDTGPQAWSHRRSLQAELLREQQPDIIALQEVLYGQKSYLDSLLTDYDHIGVGREDGATQGEYTPLYYRRDRFDCVDSGYQWLSETPHTPSRGWDAACERMVVWLLLSERDTDRTLLVLNTHLDHVGTVARQQAVQQILYLADSIAPGSPTLLMGDLNATMADEPLQHLTSAELATPFVDSRTAAAEQEGQEWSFHDFGQIPISERALIDHILYRGAIVPLRHAILPEATTHTDSTSASTETTYRSDHLPILLDFEL